MTAARRSQPQNTIDNGRGARLGRFDPAHTKRLGRESAVPARAAQLLVHRLHDLDLRAGQDGHRAQAKMTSFRAAAARQRAKRRHDSIFFGWCSATENCGIRARIGNHLFRAAKATAYLKNGGSLEMAQHITGHESPQRTQFYDRRREEISLEEVERIAIRSTRLRITRTRTILTNATGLSPFISQTDRTSHEAAQRSGRSDLVHNWAVRRLCTERQ